MKQCGIKYEYVLLTITCTKLTIETQVQGANYAQRPQ